MSTSTGELYTGSTPLLRGCVIERVSEYSTLHGVEVAEYLVRKSPHFMSGQSTWQPGKTQVLCTEFVRLLFAREEFAAPEEEEFRTTSNGLEDA